MWFLKKKKITQMDLFTKQKKTHRHRKQTSGYQKEKGEGRDKFGSLGLTDTDCQILNR